MAISEATDGIATKFAGFVQNKSKASVAITAAGAYGSTIQSYTTTILGINYSGASITSGILSSAGSVAVVTTVTDSRGRQASVTNTITVIAYDNPSIAAFSAQRCNAAGTPNDEGTSLLVSMTFNISAVNNKNDKAYLLEYKTSNAETWNTLTSGNVYTFNSIYKSLAGLFNGDNFYNLRLTLTDYFGSASAIIELPTAFTLVDFSASGKGIAFGKVAAADGFACDLPTVFTDKVYLSEADRVAGKDADARVLALENMVSADWIVEQGTSGFWEYTKWNSGKCLVEGEFKVAYDAGILWSSGFYYHKTTGTITYPFTIHGAKIQFSKQDAILAKHVGTIKGVAGGDFAFYVENSYAAASTADSAGIWLATITGRWKE